MDIIIPTIIILVAVVALILSRNKDFWAMINQKLKGTDPNKPSNFVEPHRAHDVFIDDPLHGRKKYKGNFESKNHITLLDEEGKLKTSKYEELWLKNIPAVVENGEKTFIFELRNDETYNSLTAKLSAANLKIASLNKEILGLTETTSKIMFEAAKRRGEIYNAENKYRGYQPPTYAKRTQPPPQAVESGEQNAE